MHLNVFSPTLIICIYTKRKDNILIVCHDDGGNEQREREREKERERERLLVVKVGQGKENGFVFLSLCAFYTSIHRR